MRLEIGDKTWGVGLIKAHTQMHPYWPVENPLLRTNVESVEALFLFL